MIKIDSQQLARLIDLVDPHRPASHRQWLFDGVLLEAADGWLHAVATDGVNMAVARAAIESDTWKAPVDGKSLRALRAWLDSVDIVHLHYKPRIGRIPALLAAHEAASAIMLPVSGTDPAIPWRAVLKNHLPGPDAGLLAQPVMLTSALLARWQHTGTTLNFWQASGDAPVVAADTDFIGLDYTVDLGGPESRSQLVSLWADSLRDKRLFHDGTAYDASATYTDRHGDRWLFITDRNEDGEVMVRPEDWDPAQEGFPLPTVIRELGPLTRATP